MKILRLLLSLMLVFCFSSCALNPNTPDTVTIGDKEYTKAFSGELYPASELISNNSVKLSGSLYYQYSKPQYGCYIVYDRNAEPNVYFESEKLNEAGSYYGDSSNFFFFCLLGNVHNENDQQIFLIEKIEPSAFNSLLEFSKENDHNPLTSFNSKENLKKIPIPNPDDWMANEIHFYKESKDRAFCTSKGYTFIMHDNQLYLLYQYDFGDESNPLMLVREIPADISDYFCTLLKELQNE